MTKTTRNVLLLIVGLVVFCAIAIVGFGVWFFTSALEQTPADVARATESFAEVRGRFQNGEPLLSMTPQGPVFVRQPPATPPARDLESLRLIAWDPEEGQLARVTIPFWLVRLKEGPFSISASTILPNVRVSMTADELERYGPSLLLDQQDEDGSRVLIWSE
jgi:hypothetical protein